MTSTTTTVMDEAPDPELTSPGGKLVVAAVSIISFLLIGTTMASLGVYFPALQTALGWSEQDLGSIAAALLVGIALASITAGWLLNAIGPRKLLLAGIALVVVGDWWAATAVDLLQMVSAMALIGAGVGAATIIPGATVINRWYVRHRGVAMAFFIGAIVIASAVVPPITEMVVQAFGWRYAFGVSGAITAVVGVSLAMMVRLPPVEHLQLLNGTNGETKSRAVSGMTVREGLRFSRFWVLVLALTLVQLSINGILYNVITYLIAEGFTSGNAVTIYSVANLCGLPGLFVCGYLADRYGANRIIPVATVVLAIGTFALLAVNIQAQFVIAALGAFIILWGVASGIPSQIGPVLLAELVGMRAFPALLGIKGAIVSLVGALAPVATGMLFAVKDSYHLPFLVSGMLALIAAPLFLVVRSSNQQAV